MYRAKYSLNLTRGVQHPQQPFRKGRIPKEGVTQYYSVARGRDPA